MATTPIVAPMAAGRVALLRPAPPPLPLPGEAEGDAATLSVPPPPPGRGTQGPTAPGGLDFTPLRCKPGPHEVQPDTELKAQVRQAMSHTPAVRDLVVREVTGWVLNWTPARDTKGRRVARVDACTRTGSRGCQWRVSAR